MVALAGIVNNDQCSCCLLLAYAVPALCVDICQLVASSYMCSILPDNLGTCAVSACPAPDTRVPAYTAVISYFLRNPFVLVTFGSTNRED